MAVVAVYFFQRSFIYHPENFYVAPNATNGSHSLQEFEVETKDGLHLKGWYAPATSRPLTIVFFHGNGDNLRTAAAIATPYIDAGYGFLLAEYRGYSGEEGNPSEQGLYSDARAYIAKLIEQGLTEKDMVLYGHSLGSAVALQMATEFDVAGLIMLSPFTSIVDMADLNFYIFPVDELLKDRYENIHKIGKVRTKLLMAGGDQDKVVPPEQGKALFARANEPKIFQTMPGRGHNDLFDDFAKISLPWLDQLQEWQN